MALLIMVKKGNGKSVEKKIKKALRWAIYHPITISVATVSIWATFILPNFLPALNWLYTIWWLLTYSVVVGAACFTATYWIGKLEGSVSTKKHK